MTKKEFDKIFNDCVSSSRNIDETKARLLSFGDENGKIDLERATAFVYMETTKYSADLLYSVLSKVLDIEE